MYGLSKDEDLCFLIGAELLQICFGRYHAILNFHGDIVISLECNCRVMPSHGDWQPAYSPGAAAALLTLLEQHIIETVNLGDGSPSLKFSGGATLLVQDTNRLAESYQITNGNQHIVV